MLNRSLRRFTLAFVLVPYACFVYADDEPTATPYRPSVSTPAALSQPGWLDAEFGWQRSKGGDAVRRDSLPYTLKLAFSPDWGIRLGGELQVINKDLDGNRLSGVGDTVFVLKRRFAIDEEKAFGLEAGVKSPTAKDGLGSGKADQWLNGIFSADIGKQHLDINLIQARIGGISPDEGRWQTTLATALSRSLNDRWGIVGELSGSRQSGTPSTAQFLTAASYNFSKRVVFDMGLSAGLTHASSDWTVFTGVTVLLGKVF